MKITYKHGFTLIEIMVVMGLSSLLFAIFAPTYRGVQKSWEQTRAMSEIRQNGFVSTDFINKQLRQAQKIISLSNPEDGNGYISFQTESGNTHEFLIYTDATNDNARSLEWNQDGSLATLTDSISEFYVSATDKDGNPTTTPALIQSLTIKVLVTDAEGHLSAQSFTTHVNIRKNIIPALSYVCFAGGSITLSGSGSIEGDMHANNTLSLSGISLTGTSTSGSTEPLPDANITSYTTMILPVASYREYATTVITGNYTFTKNNTYTGIYYIAGGGTATIEKNVDINGAVYAEGDLIIDGQNVTVIGSGSLPALVADNDIIVSDFTDLHFRVTGTAYAHRDVVLPGKDTTMTAGTAFPIALGAGRDLSFSGFDFTAYGTVVAGRNMAFGLINKKVTISANAPYPAILSGSHLYIKSRDITLSGLVWTSGNIQLDSFDLQVEGVLVAGGDIEGDNPISLVYSEASLLTPPPYMAEGSL